MNPEKLPKTPLSFLWNKMRFVEDNNGADKNPPVIIKKEGLTDMKATGIVRRIDDLGRVVIPKEIRRTLRIREGDPLEIYTEKDGEVIFKKYSPMGELSDFAGQMCETISKTTGLPAAIADRDSVISVCGVPKRELAGKPITQELEQIMEARQVYRRTPGERPTAIAEGAEKYAVSVAAPIISEGDVMGCVIFFGEGDTAAGEVEYKLAQTVAGFLGRQMEG